MPKFLLHEPLAVDLFNESHNTATGLLQPWSKYLTNSVELLELMTERMESDFTALSAKMRKAYTTKDVDA